MQYIGRGSAHVQTIPRVPPIVNTGYFVFEPATFLLWQVRVILFRFATMPSRSRRHTSWNSSSPRSSTWSQ